MTEQLDRLIAEREPDPDVLERERLIRGREYKDAFYVSLESLTVAAVEREIERAARQR